MSDQPTAPIRPVSPGQPPSHQLPHQLPPDELPTEALPVADGAGESDQKPPSVFVDPSGRRRRWLVVTLAALATLAVGYLTLLLLSVFGAPLPSIAKLPLPPGVRESDPSPTVESPEPGSPTGATPSPGTSPSATAPASGPGVSGAPGATSAPVSPPQQPAPPAPPAPPPATTVPPTAAPTTAAPSSAESTGGSEAVPQTTQGGG